jgi:hypothetical protein
MVVMVRGVEQLLEALVVLDHGQVVLVVMGTERQVVVVVILVQLVVREVGLVLRNIQVQVVQVVQLS